MSPCDISYRIFLYSLIILCAEIWFKMYLWDRKCRGFFVKRGKKKKKKVLVHLFLKFQLQRPLHERKLNTLNVDLIYLPMM